MCCMLACLCLCVFMSMCLCIRMYVICGGAGQALVVSLCMCVRVCYIWRSGPKFCKYICSFVCVIYKGVYVCMCTCVMLWRDRSRLCNVYICVFVCACVCVCVCVSMNQYICVNICKCVRFEILWSRTIWKKSRQRENTGYFVFFAWSNTGVSVYVRMHVCVHMYISLILCAYVYQSHLTKKTLKI